MKNTILSQSDLILLEDTILQFGRIVNFQQLVSLFSRTETRDAIRRKVALLVKKGWLIRLKKGQYLVVTDISTLGVSDISEYVVSQVLHKDSYISFENALQYHGLFDQLLGTVRSVTITYAREYRVQNTTYAFSKIKKDLYFGFTEEVFGSYKAQIAEKEKALLDMLYFRNSTHIVNLVLEKLREYQHRLDLSKLKTYAQNYGVGMERMIGFLLDQINVDTIDLLTRVKRKHNSYYKLTRQSTLFDAKWRLYYDTNTLI